MRLPVSIVNACVRDGTGGSPTAVLEADPTGADLPEALDFALRPDRFGTSHVVVLTRPPAAASPVDLRFFTTDGELPACGHGTVAALAWLAGRHPGGEQEFTLRVSGRTFPGRTVRDGDLVQAHFDPGPITSRAATPAETECMTTALKLTPDRTSSARPRAVIATLGRPRMLLPIASTTALAALTPDLTQLRETCDRLGLLGCYVHSPPSGTGRVAARMFAPSIGVPEDIANANSTACLAAQGFIDLTVDLGDALGHPATITTSTRPGPRVLVGGTALLPAQAR
jgi:PhzF family phenazine biosynthesis protein